MKNRNKLMLVFLSVVATQFFISCDQETIDEKNATIPYEPIGGYESSDEIAPNNLIVKCSFEDNIVDAKGNLQQFWEKVNVEKMSYEEAALNTFTGKWAKENGFSKVRIKNQKDIEPDEVTLVILKNK